LYTDSIQCISQISHQIQFKMSDDNEEALIKCGSTKGDFSFRLIRNWAPFGYDRAVKLFEKGFYDE
jgi:hypothetical protein